MELESPIAIEGFGRCVHVGDVINGSLVGRIVGGFVRRTHTITGELGRVYPGSVASGGRAATQQSELDKRWRSNRSGEE
jgi:hypothetical protein